MAIRADFHFSKSIPVQFQPRLITFRRYPTRINCKSNSASDEDLSTKFASEVVKLKLKKNQREEAIVKSRKILFGEMAAYLGFNEDEMMKRWKVMAEIDKWVVVEGFLSEWGEHFHPLSAKSVKGLVEEHLEFESLATQVDQISASSSVLIGLKKMIGMD